MGGTGTLEGMMRLAQAAVAFLLLTVPAGAQTTGSTGPAVATRAGLAISFQRTYLSNGFDMSVMAQEKPIAAGGDAFKQWPRLVFFGWQGQSLVYTAVTDGNVLAQAKAAGFKGVEFFDKGRNGRWFFDVSGPDLPRCDVMKRLCL